MILFMPTTKQSPLSDTWSTSFLHLKQKWPDLISCVKAMCMCLEDGFGQV